jgi:hypothetical protein
MKKFKGGQEVGGGTYWNLETGEKVVVENEGTLPGDNGTIYLRVTNAALKEIESGCRESD